MYIFSKPHLLWLKEQVFENTQWKQNTFAVDFKHFSLPLVFIDCEDYASSVKSFCKLV